MTDERFRPPPWVLFSGVCVLLSVLFYRDFVFGPETMLFGTDMLDQAYQLRKFGVEEIKSGRGFPLWNPFVYGGLPYLAVLPGPIRPAHGPGRNLRLCGRAFTASRTLGQRRRRPGVHVHGHGRLHSVWRA